MIIYFHGKNEGSSLLRPHWLFNLISSCIMTYSSWVSLSFSLSHSVKPCSCVPQEWKTDLQQITGQRLNHHCFLWMRQFRKAVERTQFGQRQRNRERENKTKEKRWLSEQRGTLVSIQNLLEDAYFFSFIQCHNLHSFLSTTIFHAYSAFF